MYSFVLTSGETVASRVWRITISAALGEALVVVQTWVEFPLGHLLSK